MKKPSVWALALLPLSVLFLELMLKITCPSPFTFPEIIGIVLFSLGAGFFLNLFCLIFRSETANRYICFAIVEILTILFLFMFFMNNSYRVYMDPKSIAAGAGNVVTGFGDTIVTALTGGIGYILLFHIPAAVTLVLAITKKGSFSHKKGFLPVLSLIICLVLSCASPFIMTAKSSSREQYTSAYSFDESVRNFGLLTSLKLETVYSVFGNPFNTISIDIPEFEPAPLPPEETHTPDDETPPDDLPDPDDAPIDGDAEPPEDVIVPEEPEPIVYGNNVLNIDFDALIAEAGSASLQNLHKYVQSLTPSSQNEYTGLFRGKNLILITAEAFSKEVIDEERTPALYRMATKGIVFEDYYQPAWGGSTSTGEFSVITGIIPVYKVASVTLSTGHNFAFTMGSQLMRLGYENGAYHNGSYTYYSRDKTHTYYGYSKFIGMGNGMEKGVTQRWPESDNEMFRFIMPEYIESGKPFSLYFMSVSGHCNYSTSGNSMSLKNWDIVRDMDASDTIKAYHAANYEFELAMEYLLDALTEAGIADDTVVVISTDHYPYGLESSAAWATDRDYLSELFGYPANSNPARDHSALIIWSGCLEESDPIVVSSPVYSIDIVPTLSNLFGIDYDSRLLVGRDALSDTEALVIWQDSDWKTDKGYYEASSGVFYPEDGVTVDQAYIDRIKTIVKNKKSYSQGILDYDYYKLVEPKIITQTEEAENEN